jgi:RNA polymerase sigma factor (sigma-70 family)
MTQGWGAPRGPTPPDSGDESTERREGALPPDVVEYWRTWLLTGHSGAASDPRRLRGSHRGLKKMLAEGTATDLPQSWRHVSAAMVRLAINDALNALPKDKTHVVWLAYFGGMSNEQIAKRLGLSVGGVQRRLKQAFESVSDYVEHGRTAGRNAVLAILGWLSLRRLFDAAREGPEPISHVVVAGAIVVAAASAAVIMGNATQPVVRPGLQPSAVSHAAAPIEWTAPVTASGLASAAVPLSRSITAAVTSAERTALSNTGARAVPPVLPPLPSPLPSPLPLPTPSLP